MAEQTRSWDLSCRKKTRTSKTITPRMQLAHDRRTVSQTSYQKVAQIEKMSKTQDGRYRRRYWWQFVLWAIFSALLWMIPERGERIEPGITRVRWIYVGHTSCVSGDMAKVISTVLRSQIPLRLLHSNA
jgi:hypothetical protein